MSDMHKILEDLFDFGKKKPEPEEPKSTSTGDLKQFALAFLKRWAHIVPADTPFSHETVLRHKENGRVFRITTTIVDETVKES